MTNNTTTIINFLGGPGSGKSTLAAHLYASLKTSGLSVELVQEAAKVFAYKKEQISFYGQLALFGEQLRREETLYDKVDVIITDCPLYLIPLYEQVNHKTNYLNTFIPLIKARKEINILLDRGSLSYVNEGRYEDRTKALDIDLKLEDMLRYNQIAYSKINPKDYLEVEHIKYLIRRLSGG